MKSKKMIYAPSRRFYPSTTTLTKNLIAMYDIQILEEILLKSDIDKILYLIPKGEDKRLYMSIENSLKEFVERKILFFENWESFNSKKFYNTNILLTDVSKIAYYYSVLTFNYSILYLPFLMDEELNIFKTNNSLLIICNNIGKLVHELNEKSTKKNRAFMKLFFEGLL